MAVQYGVVALYWEAVQWPLALMSNTDKNWWCTGQECQVYKSTIRNYPQNWHKNTAAINAIGPTYPSHTYWWCIKHVTQKIQVHYFTVKIKNSYKAVGIVFPHFLRWSLQCAIWQVLEQYLAMLHCEHLFRVTSLDSETWQFKLKHILILQMGFSMSSLPDSSVTSSLPRWSGCLSRGTAGEIFNCESAGMLSKAGSLFVVDTISASGALQASDPTEDWCGCSLEDLHFVCSHFSRLFISPSSWGWFFLPFPFHAGFCTGFNARNYVLHLSHLLYRFQLCCAIGRLCHFTFGERFWTSSSPNNIQENLSTCSF